MLKNKRLILMIFLLFGMLFFVELVKADAIIFPTFWDQYLPPNVSTVWDEIGDYYNAASVFVETSMAGEIVFNMSLNDTRFFNFTYLSFLDGITGPQGAPIYSAYLEDTRYIPPGSYAFNLSVVRDTGKVYDETLLTIYLTPKTEICQVLFNETSASVEETAAVSVYTNCSSAFVLAKNGTTIENGSTQSLTAGAYNFSFTRNDTVNYSNNYNETQFRVLAKANPTFTTIPANASLFYENESLSSVFLGADNVGFGYYSLNDTRFSVTRYSNGTGVLKNATSLGAGNYEINVTINDSTNNTNWTRYKIQINQSLGDCGIYFNTTSPLTYPENFIVYTNCSSNYTISRNGSAVSNNSVINSGAGYYNLSVQRTDTVNYTNIFHEQYFKINQNTEDCKVLFDTTSPVTYGTSFKVYANCSTDFVLYKDGTEIENNSEQSLDAGTYNFSFQRTDSSNYSINYNETTFTVTEAAATINSNVGGGSGGGSNPNAPKTYTADETVISSTQGETFELKPLDKVSFEIRESTHTATLNSYTSTTARITIRSTPFSVLLEKGILKELDLNNDLINDLAIRYDGLINGKVSLFMKEILPVAEEIPETNENTAPEEDTNLNDSQELPTGGETKLKKLTLLLIIFFSVVIVFIVLYISITLIKNYKRR